MNGKDRKISYIIRYVEKSDNYPEEIPPAGYFAFQYRYIPDGYCHNYSFLIFTA